MCCAVICKKGKEKGKYAVCKAQGCVCGGVQFARGLRGRFYRGVNLGLGTKGGVRISGAWGKDVLVKVHGGGGKDVPWLVLTK